MINRVEHEKLYMLGPYFINRWFNKPLYILLFLRNYDFMRITGLSRKHFRNVGISEILSEP